ncbi:uncharacterized protein PV09_02542 [Verruconis gallopava]|uniref:Heme haloperoxidase family profile domain-containing protein n=1 Tax=Verruconis gallopava TaxID=253628 RepID=A0A0D1XVQ4_9PEZI|nr:uncharacterized protein PV09_02542 [Verruconis gallopava]KIW06866.1 hypothetical protein PV09_02542 [Verruconis gallopava]
MRLLPASLLALLNTALGYDSEPSCRTSSLPNPIAAQYYANITGTLNGTLAVLPIPLSMARRIIPSQYEILTEQYRALMPDLPRDMYPALLQAVFDHDIRYMEYSMPDFSRASIEFPFVRYYKDANTPFRYNPDMFMTSTNQMGINASREYGGEVYPAEFEPACDAYAHAEDGITSYKARARDAYLDTTWQHMADSSPPSSLMTFIMHTTNQPLFGVDGMCNLQKRMFGTSLSTGAHAPRSVVGAVRANIPSVSKSDMMWSDVAGVQVNTAFIEKHMIPCEEVRSWTYDEAETLKDPAGGSGSGSLEL